MTVITFNVPLVLTAEDNLTYANKATILIKDCSSFGNPNSECDGFNFNKCPNDESYCQPFIQGDLIYNQLKFDNTKDTLVGGEFINAETGDAFLPTSGVSFQIGIDALNNSYINTIFDTSNVVFDNISCFYIRFNLRQGEKDIYYTSEPYCKVSCDMPTILIEGSYPNGYDCFGNYYGNISLLGFSSPTIYKPVYRIRAVVEPDGFDFEETTMNNKRIKSKQSERFWLMTKKIPYYVAKQLAICFNSKLVTIDGIEYTGTIKLNKNFDEGSMWIIKENIYIVCDEKTFTCS